jgi:hypothetical protein
MSRSARRGAWRVRTAAAVSAACVLLAGCTSGQGAAGKGAAGNDATGTGATVEKKSPIAGLVDRKGFPPAGKAGVVRSFVVEAPWREVQPDNGDQLVTSRLDAEISRAKAEGMHVKLRVTAGMNAPDWVRRAAGTVTMTGADNVGAISATEWWKPTYIAAYDALQAKLADRYDADPTVLENYLCGPTVQYCEPYLRLIGAGPGNRAVLARAGRTDEADEEALRANIKAGRHWKRTPLTIAFNPMGPDGSVSTADMREFRQTYGCRAVIANHSLSQTRAAAIYRDLYAEQKRLGPPLAYQTATGARIGDREQTLQFAIAQGASSVELPSGFARWPLADLERYETQLEANPRCRG